MPIYGFSESFAGYLSALENIFLRALPLSLSAHMHNLSVSVSIYCFVIGSSEGSVEGRNTVRRKCRGVILKCI